MSEQTTKTVKPEEETRKQTFEVKLRKEDIEQVVKSTSILVEEIQFFINPEGLCVRCMDPSHVALIDVSLPNACFEKYSVESDFNIGLRADELEKMIKMFDKNSSITITKTESDELILSNKTEKYTLRLIEVSEHDTPLPKIPYDAKIDLGRQTDLISTKDFIKQLEKIGIISDYVSFDTSINWFKLSGKGDIGKAEANYEQGQLDISVKQDASSTYSLEYTLPFLKTVKDSPLTLEYSSGKPLRLESKLANIGRLHYYLAPRVES